MKKDLLVKLEDERQKWKGCMRENCTKEHADYLSNTQDRAIREAHATCTAKKCKTEFDGLLEFHKNHAAKLREIYSELVSKNKAEMKTATDPMRKRVLRAMIEVDSLSLKMNDRIAKVSTMEEYYEVVSKLYLGA